MKGTYVCRFQNVVLRCPTPRLHRFLSSHWPSFRFLSFMAFHNERHILKSARSISLFNTRTENWEVPVPTNNTEWPRNHWRSTNLSRGSVCALRIVYGVLQLSTGSHGYWVEVRWFVGHSVHEPAGLPSTNYWKWDVTSGQFHTTDALPKKKTPPLTTEQKLVGLTVLGDFEKRQTTWSCSEWNTIRG